MTTNDIGRAVDQRLRMGLTPRPDPNGKNDVKIIAGLADFYRLLKLKQSNLPEVYQPGGEWKVYIETRQPLYQLLLDGRLEEATEIFRNFWRNELGPIVSQYAYYSDIADGDIAKARRFVDCMTRDMAIWRGLHQADPSELSVPAVGNPWGYIHEGVLITPQALRFHNHALQIGQMLSGEAAPLMAEIGGGYGGMYYYLSKLAKQVRYVNFDLPETLVIAAYYLLKIFPNKKMLLYDGRAKLTRSVLTSYDICLMPNFALPDLESDSCDIFYNTFSLSEMPYTTIEEYIRQIERVTRGYFLHNNVDREGVVNRGHPRTPCSRYPIRPSLFKTLYKKYDLYQQSAGDYREVLYQRVR